MRQHTSKKSTTVGSSEKTSDGKSAAQLKDKRPEAEQTAQLQTSANQFTGQSETAVAQFMPRGRGHAAATYVVTVSHPNANNGTAEVYYRDNVQGHPAQRAVIAAAVQAFTTTYGNLANIARNGRVAPGGAPAGATAV